MDNQNIGHTFEEMMDYIKTTIQSIEIALSVPDKYKISNNYDIKFTTETENTNYENTNYEDNKIFNKDNIKNYLNNLTADFKNQYDDKPLLFNLSNIGECKNVIPNSPNCWCVSSIDDIDLKKYYKHTYDISSYIENILSSFEEDEKKRILKSIITKPINNCCNCIAIVYYYPDGTTDPYNMIDKLYKYLSNISYSITNISNNLSDYIVKLYLNKEVFIALNKIFATINHNKWFEQLYREQFNIDINKDINKDIIKYLNEMYQRVQFDENSELDMIEYLKQNNIPNSYVKKNNFGDETYKLIDFKYYYDIYKNLKSIDYDKNKLRDNIDFINQKFKYIYKFNNTSRLNIITNLLQYYNNKKKITDLLEFVKNIFNSKNVELYIYECFSIEMGYYRSLRFLPLFEDNVNVCIVREADGCVSLADCQNIKIFEKSETAIMIYDYAYTFKLKTYENPEYISDTSRNITITNKNINNIIQHIQGKSRDIATYIHYSQWLSFYESVFLNQDSEFIRNENLKYDEDTEFINIYKDGKYSFVDIAAGVFGSKIKFTEDYKNKILTLISNQINSLQIYLLKNEKNEELIKLEHEKGKLLNINLSLLSSKFKLEKEKSVNSNLEEINNKIKENNEQLNIIDTQILKHNKISNLKVLKELEQLFKTGYDEILLLLLYGIFTRSRFIENKYVCDESVCGDNIVKNYNSKFNINGDILKVKQLDKNDLNKKKNNLLLIYSNTSQAENNYYEYYSNLFTSLPIEYYTTYLEKIKFYFERILPIKDSNISSYLSQEYLLEHLLYNFPLKLENKEKIIGKCNIEQYNIDNTIQLSNLLINNPITDPIYNDFVKNIIYFKIKPQKRNSRDEPHESQPNPDNTKYLNKYLKYKQKYLKLKKLI
jgi:hypothetical protein